MTERILVQRPAVSENGRLTGIARMLQQSAAKLKAAIDQPMLRHRTICGLPTFGSRTAHHDCLAQEGR